MRDKDQQLIYELYIDQTLEEGIINNLAAGLISLLTIIGSSGCSITGLTDPVWIAKQMGHERIPIFKCIPENSSVWQENGGKYNRLVFEIVIEGIGEPEWETGNRYPKWVKKATRFWENRGHKIMELRLREGHPSAVLWNKAGRKFEIEALTGKDLPDNERPYEFQKSKYQNPFKDSK